MTTMSGGSEGLDGSHHDDASAALARVLDGLGGCLETARHLQQRNRTTRAAGYVLGALDDLAPELAILAELKPPNR